MKIPICFLLLSIISCSDDHDNHAAITTKKDSALFSTTPEKIKIDNSEKVSETKIKTPDSTTAISQCSCEAGGYFEETLAKIFIYPSPNDSGGKIIYPDVSFIFAEIECNRGDWFQLKNIRGNDDKEFKKFRHWWVKVGDFSTCTSEINYTLKLFNSPSDTSKVIGYLPESSFPILQCTGKWIKAEGLDKQKKKVRGWLRRDILCGNPYTNCGYSLKTKYIYKIIRQ